MKTLRILNIIVALMISIAFHASASVTITAATGGGSLTPCSYTPLGSIIITENSNTDISANQSNVTLKLTAPSGFEFNPGVGSVTYTSGKDITSCSINITVSTITVTFTTDATADAKDKITISGIQAKASYASPLASNGIIYRSAINAGTATINGIANGSTNFGSFSQAPNLTYSSSAVTQTNTNRIDAYSLNNQIIGIQVVVSGCGGTLNATTFSLSTTGSTDAKADIDSAKLYYTGTSSTFATTTLFGKQSTPNTNYTITGNIALSAGTNYFWLAYDCLGANNNDHVDAACNTIMVGGSNYTPSPTTVTGTRSIFQHCPGGYKDAGNTLIVNGTFDVMPGQSGSGFSSDYTYVANVAPDPATSGTECWPEKTYSVTDKASNVHSNWSRQTKGVSGSGNLMVVNGAPTDNVTIWNESNLACRPGVIYFFSTWVSSVHPLNPAQLRFSINGVQQGPEFSPPSDTANNWVQYYTTWNSGSSTQVALSIVNKNIIANGNDFALDDIYMCPCMAETLPVELLDFSATAVNQDQIILNWSTASETNNDYFTIEKSFNAIDFKAIATVKGAGNSNTKLSYDLKDNKGFEGNQVCYYRLKQTDYDGKFQYSNIVSVNINKVKPQITSFNNNGNIVINVTQSQSCQTEISIVDLLGQVLYTDKKNIEEGNNTFTLNTTLKTRSVYLVSLRNLSTGEMMVIKAY